MPAECALHKCRANSGVFCTLSMLDFTTLGVLRHLKGVTTLRAMVQDLAHEVDRLERLPIARSTWGDALASGQRQEVLHQLRTQLLAKARTACPDRLASLPSLGKRAVYAMDGSYQHESAHFYKKTKDEGGDHNPKGHCLLSAFDVRLGCVADVHVDIRSRHEIPIMEDYDAKDGALTAVKGALWLVDRAFIKAGYWDLKNTRAVSP